MTPPRFLVSLYEQIKNIYDQSEIEEQYLSKGNTVHAMYPSSGR